MPRTEVDLPYRVDYLSVLDEDGHLDEELEPALPNELLLKLYRAMVLARRFDERMLSLQRQGRIGTFAPIKGQEAAQLGTVAALRPSDWMVPSFREGAAEVWRGKSLESILLYYAGYDEGGLVEDGRNDLPVSIPVGSQTLHAVGIAYAIKYRNENHVAMTFFGDGATSEGDFHEAMNFAGVFQLPVIFVCQNNHWAISIPRSKQTRAKTLAQKALAYGMPGIQVDGNDILAVHVAAQEAVERARSGGGPTLIECVTYRMAMHTTADDPKRYRSDEDVAQWAKRDPITRFQTYLKLKGLLADDAVAAIEQEVLAEVQGAVDRAEAFMKTPANPLAMFDHAFAEPPANLRRQRSELERELTAEREEVEHG